MIEEDGYYTLVIESSFSVIERTIQFDLLEEEIHEVDDYVTHESVYEVGQRTGLYDADFGDRLLELWRNNRSRTNYREGLTHRLPQRSWSRMSDSSTIMYSSCQVGVTSASAATERPLGPAFPPASSRSR